MKKNAKCDSRITKLQAKCSEMRDRILGVNYTKTGPEEHKEDFSKVAKIQYDDTVDLYIICRRTRPGKLHRNVVKHYRIKRENLPVFPAR